MKKLYSEDLKELKNIEGASWLEFNYYVKKPDSTSNNRINSLNNIIYILRYFEN